MKFSQFLHSVPAFMDFSESELDILERTLMVKDYPEGHVFVKEGKAADEMYLIVRGEVAVSRYHDEFCRQGVLERLQSGELFGLIALIDQGPRSATCTAESEVTVASLPRAAFELLFQSDAWLGYHFQHMIARQLVRDLRIYTDALQEGIAAQNRYRMYKALERSTTYRGPERRNNDRRRAGDRRQVHPRSQ
jgi:CRP-like cAMP-binding protein